jgi:DNA-binding transcriptional MerR regulator
MTASQVADRLGVSRSRVHQLDAELRPERCACGTRLYNADAVAAYAVKRAADLAALSRARSAWMRELRKRL